MDAFVLGAVPPYSSLLGAKLIAMLATSTEVRQAFRRKYGGSRSLIKGSKHDGRLAMITTTSALGRSSLYNRLRFGSRPVFERIGVTGGFGEFQFCNGVYDAIKEYADGHCEKTAKHEKWGSGFRNRREVVRKCLGEVGLSLNHGVQREIYVAPLAENCREFLCGKHVRLKPHKATSQELFEFFKERWLLPRAASDKRFRSFKPMALRLW
jgi:hypothetical protein